MREIRPTLGRIRRVALTLTFIGEIEIEIELDPELEEIEMEVEVERGKNGAFSSHSS